MSTYNILAGDCVRLLPELAPAIVQAIITSPPYWGLRDYGIAPTEWPEIRYAPMAGLPDLVIPAMVCCLGLEATPEAFIGHLLHVFRLAAPALKREGTCWVNLGDTYTGSRCGGNSEVITGKGRDEAVVAAKKVREAQHLSRRRDRTPIPRSDKQVEGLPPKNLVGIPWRFAFAMQADGWILRQDLIWSKPNPMPESVTDRCTKAHEYIFLLSKSPRYYFDTAAIKEPSVQPGRERADRIGGNKYEGEKNSEQFVFNGSDIRNKRSVWTVATKPYSEAHFATFPPGLIEPCILAGSRPGDLVLDMFSGSGTTGQVALQWNRAYIGIEAKPENVTLHHKRMRGLQFQLIPAA